MKSDTAPFSPPRTHQAVRRMSLQQSLIDSAHSSSLHSSDMRPGSCPRWWCRRLLTEFSSWRTPSGVDGLGSGHPRKAGRDKERLVCLTAHAGHHRTACPRFVMGSKKTVKFCGAGALFYSYYSRRRMHSCYKAVLATQQFCLCEASGQTMKRAQLRGDCERGERGRRVGRIVPEPRFSRCV